jgi:uncharacterized repeat protein (TIGR04076 family)
MKRRNFILSAMAGSVSALVSIAFSNSAATDQQEPSNKCKITIVRRAWNDGETIKSCPRFLQEGQEFIFEYPCQKPEHFCDIAWGDIQPYISEVNAGKRDPSFCYCTGTNQVLFKIERVKS